MGWEPRSYVSKRFLSFLLFFLFFTLFSFSHFAPNVSYSADYRTIQIKGSDTMVNLGQAWAEEFMQMHPDVSVAVTGGGSGTGIAAILSGTCDIAQSSRDMKPEELAKAEATGKPVQQTVVGIDGLAVVIHPNNPVSQLTLEQLADIFTGKMTNWKEAGGKDLPILILSRERNSGTHVYFLEEVLRRGNPKGPEEFAASALMMPSSQAIAQEVESSEAAIGYLGMGYVTLKQKVLAIAKTSSGPYVLPTLGTSQSGEYPISRPLYFLTRGEPEGDVKAFIDFVLSPEGQEIVRILDFVPLKSSSSPEP
jgi:phosphate transport system substrate-binding protein